MYGPQLFFSASHWVCSDCFSSIEQSVLRLSLVVSLFVRLEFLQFVYTFVVICLQIYHLLTIYYSISLQFIHVFVILVICSFNHLSIRTFVTKYNISNKSIAIYITLSNFSYDFEFLKFSMNGIFLGR